MPTSVVVKSKDEGIKANREVEAACVIRAFGEPFPESRLLCFLDDVDSAEFRSMIGSDSRGFYQPLFNARTTGWPSYLLETIRPGVPGEVIPMRVFDHVIYLHGSVCSDDVALTMTLAHEFQHFIQWNANHPMWAAGLFFVNIIADLPAEATAYAKRRTDIPHEREARIVAKRMCLALFPEAELTRLIDQRIVDSVGNDRETADWHFVKEVDPEIPYDFAAATLELYRQLKPYKSDCEVLLRTKIKAIPELKAVDLNSLFGDE